ncbi:MAG: DNA adenine methylase [Saprospiraceae bacterium]|nr:DNA adenine methylase [Saprospiraceae bacterium]
MIKSPLRYPGGKSRAAARIAALAPPFEEYREPFLGGGSVFVHLKQLFPNKKYWLNDLYPELYQFWASCQSDITKIIDQIEIWRNQFPNGKALHQYLNEHISTFDEINTAAAFFIFNRITFSGTTEAGGYSEQAFQGRFTASSIQRLPAFARLLHHVKITNEDYQNIVESAGNQVFIFLDPPYYSATKSALYGKNGKLHKIFDHERFATVLQHCTHRWLITYDDSPYIRELFHFAHITAWDLTYGMRNVVADSNQIGKELFISNYPLTEIEQAQLKLL